MQLRKRTVGVEHSLIRSPWRKDAVIELKFGVCLLRHKEEEVLR